MTWNTSKPNLEVSVSTINLNVDDLEVYTSGAEIFGGETVSELRLIEIDTTAMTADLNELTAAPVAKTITWAYRVVVTPDTSIPLTATETFVRAFWVMASRTNGLNTGTVYMYTSAVDKDDVQGIVLQPNDYWEPTIPAGIKVDLNTIYVDADTSSDGVLVGYLPI